MKIMICSDLHLDINSDSIGKDLLYDFIDFLYENIPDLLLIAGDIGNNSHYSLEVIKKIEDLTNIPIKFIPGNHDIWTTNLSSHDDYGLFKRHHSSLIDSPFILNETYAIIGDMGWYDYSFAPSTINEDRMIMYKNFYWNDASYARFNQTDIDVCNEILHRLENQLESYKDKKVIFVNHFVPYEDFIVYKDSTWNVCNGFMGSKRIGELIDRYPNIQYVIFGHTHTRFPVKALNGKMIICKPLGYQHEWVSKDFVKELYECVVFLELV